MQLDADTETPAVVPAWVWLGALPAFAARLAIAWAPVLTSFGLSVPDDGYYYFTIARNIAFGRGASFDGLNATNGFHPLWMALLTPLWWLVGANHETMPVHLALTLGTGLDLGTACGLWYLASRLGVRPAAAGLVVLAYAWNPYDVMAAVNGMETAIGGVLFVWSLAVYWREREAAETSRGRWLALGVLWSLLALARTDYLVIMLPCAIDLARRRWRSARGAWWAAAGLLLWVPWLAWNLATFGSLSQVSGRAYPYYLQTLFLAQPHSWTEWLAHLSRLAYGVVSNLGRFSGLRWALVPLVVVVPWLVWTSATRGREADRLWGLLWPTVGGLAVLFVHGLLRWVYVPWYFGPATITAMLWLGVWAERVAERHRRWAVVGAGAYLSGQLLIGAGLWWRGGALAAQRQTVEEQMPIYRVWCADAAERIGVTDSGFAGYYAHCTVVNLDGVVNNAAFDAIAAGRFREYLDEMRLDHVALNDIVRQVVELREGAVPDTPPFARSR